MHWKMKSAMQTVISLLPTSTSYALYYWVQRRFGGLRGMNPCPSLGAGVETWRRIQATGRNPKEGVFLEVGTGRVPLVPLSYWLMGASKCLTLDLNPYVRHELVAESLEYICRVPTQVAALFGNALDQRRFGELLAYWQSGRFSVDSFLALCNIEYMAPADAARTGLSSKSIDFHTSRTVLEHIPSPMVRDILVEGTRVLRPSGLFVHRIDYTDHFSHSDPGITAVNFLRFSDAAWNMYAGNRYMYMNRLRHDDFVALFEAACGQLVSIETESDPRARRALESGEVKVHAAFSGKSIDILSTAAAWIVATPGGSAR